MVKRRVAAANSRKSERPDLCDAIDRTLLPGNSDRRMVNPTTGRQIKVGGSTYISLMHGCLGCKRGMDECREIEKKGGTKINPFTNRTLSRKSAVRENLIRGCKSCAAQEMRNAVQHAIARNALRKAVNRRRSEKEQMVRRRLDALCRIRSTFKSAQEAYLASRAPGRPMRGKKRVLAWMDKLRDNVHKRKQKDARSAALRGSRVDLYDDEVMSLLGKLDEEGEGEIKLCPNVLDAGNERFLLSGVKRYIPNGGVAVIQSSGHYAAMRLRRDEEDGRYEIAYYEPFDTPMPGFTRPLRGLLKALNAGRRVPALRVHPLNWQREGGPCGVYAAYAAKALLDGLEEDQVIPRGPIDRQVDLAYEWIAANAPTYFDR